MLTTVLLDGNIYNLLYQDAETRARIVRLVADGNLSIIATPVLVDELTKSPFGVPNWFPITVKPEAIFVVGYARIGMARLGGGEVYTQHLHRSKKIPDAILAESADSLADIFVSQDTRCRNRFGKISQSCQALTYDQFKTHLLNL